MVSIFYSLLLSSLFRLCLGCYKTITVTASNNTSTINKSYQLTKVASDMFLSHQTVDVTSEESCAIACARNTCRGFQVLAQRTEHICILGSLASTETTMGGTNLIFVDDTGWYFSISIQPAYTGCFKFLPSPNST